MATRKGVQYGEDSFYTPESQGIYLQVENDTYKPMDWKFTLNRALQTRQETVNKAQLHKMLWFNDLRTFVGNPTIDFKVQYIARNDSAIEEYQTFTGTRTFTITDEHLELLTILLSYDVESLSIADQVAVDSETGIGFTYLKTFTGWMEHVLKYNPNSTSPNEGNFYNDYLDAHAKQSYKTNSLLNYDPKNDLWYWNTATIYLETEIFRTGGGIYKLDEAFNIVADPHTYHILTDVPGFSFDNFRELGARYYRCEMKINDEIIAKYMRYKTGTWYNMCIGSHLNPSLLTVPPHTISRGNVQYVTGGGDFGPPLVLKTDIQDLITPQILVVKIDQAGGANVCSNHDSELFTDDILAIVPNMNNPPDQMCVYQQDSAYECELSHGLSITTLGVKVTNDYGHTIYMRGKCIIFIAIKQMNNNAQIVNVGPLGLATERQIAQTSNVNPFQISGIY